MATGQELIQDSLLEIGVGSPGQNLSPRILNHSLRVLNRMWGLWSAKIKPINASTRDTLTWTAGINSMTIGPGGELDTIRPIAINVVQSRRDNIDRTLQEVSYEQWETTLNKTIASDFPDIFAYNPTYPLGHLFIYPEPSTNITIRIISRKPLTAFTLTGDVSLPEGYELAIQKSLAVELAPVYGKSALVVNGSPLSMAAKEALSVISMVKFSSDEMWPDGMLPGLYRGDNIDLLTN